jgi:hypothetical protein
LGAWFRKTKVFHLTLLNQIFDGASHVFDGHVRVNAVLIIQVNRIHPEPLERSLSRLFDVFWLAI